MDLCANYSNRKTLLKGFQMDNQDHKQSDQASLLEKESINQNLRKRVEYLEERLSSIEKKVQQNIRASATDQAFYDSLRERFTLIANSDNKIDIEELQTAMELRDTAYAERIFKLFDHDNDGYIDLEEFLLGVGHLVYGTDTDRLRFAYNLYDLNGSGRINKEELEHMLNACLNENQLRFTAEQIHELTTLLFENADSDNDGQIDFEEFKTLMLRNPRIKKESALSAVVWLCPAAANVQKVKLSFGLNTLEKLRRGMNFLNNNRSLIVFSLIYLAINIGLFANAMLSYADQGANLYVQIARGCGACLNFNGALILVPMLRHFLTWLRNSRVGNYVPLDHHIEFHKAIAHIMFLLSIVHTGAHLLNYQTFDLPVWKSLIHTNAGLSGLLLLVVFIVMWFFAIDKVKRTSRFEIFYITHFAFVLWFALALLHGPVFWQWVLLPIIAYASEKIYRIFSTNNPVNIKRVELLNSRVTHLCFDQPKRFKQKAGDYVFIKIPAISKFEWHPFTLTSCPEDDELSVHIRSAGDWTGELNEHFTKLQKETGQDSLLELPENSRTIYVDGPYGTPSVKVMDSEVAVIIGAGIGVTPFASVLKTILASYKNKEVAVKAPQKIYFVWLNRSQKAFEWFAELLKEVELEDKKRLVDINIYMTAGKTDFTASILNLAMDLSYDFTNIDLVTGFNARTHFGRPNWSRMFTNIAKAETGKKVDVFFCGAPVLAKQLNKQCNQFNFSFHTEKF